ncbi:MAG TPA: P-II family nitrogen regulator [Planctomycetota bacterium]|nr:P-II family nitrogen regulator [Planctomycetota bacterium]
MKKYKAYIKPFKLEPLLHSLPKEGVHSVLISEVRGYGRQKGQLELYAGSEYEWTFLPKARVEIYCDESAAAAVDKALIENSRTGRIGDGKILVQTVEQVESVD